MPTLVEMLADADLHDISLTNAAPMTDAYRNDNPGAKIGGMFGKAAIQALLAQDDCAGLRYYFAYDSNDDLTLVITAVDLELNDIYNGRLCDIAMPCPNQCSTSNPLNTSPIP